MHTALSIRIARAETNVRRQRALVHRMTVAGWDSSSARGLLTCMETSLGILRERADAAAAEFAFAWKPRKNGAPANYHRRLSRLVTIVRAVAQKGAESAADLADYTAHFDGRLNAIARVHALLARSPDDCADLEEIVWEEFIHQGAALESVSVKGPRVQLPPVAAEWIALALHELGTNAVKYGALAFPGASIAVSWRKEPAGENGGFVLSWRESGVRALMLNPGKSGFGRDLIEQCLPRELGGATALRFAPNGAACDIHIPLRGPE